MYGFGRSRGISTNFFPYDARFGIIWRTELSVSTEKRFSSTQVPEPCPLT